MAVLNRFPVLSRSSGRAPHAGPVPCRGRSWLKGYVLRVIHHMLGASLMIFWIGLLQGCGLMIDGIQMVYPVTTNELDGICRRGQVHVGMAVEPFRPFVFPAVWTDEGARVTGFDTELVQAVSDALSVHCGTAVIPQLHLVRFRDLFLLLNENQLDFFVSAVAAGVPSPARSGFAYSSPYFTSGGLTGISQRPEVLMSIQARLRPNEPPGTHARALDGLAIAVQDGTEAHLYAEALLKPKRLLVCDSLPAAFEYGGTEGAASIDVILGAKPVLDFVVKTTRRDWRVLTSEQGRPMMFNESDYAVVMAEESYRLRWFINEVIFQLRERGRLDTMRQRWMSDSYAYPRRASTEGLPFDVHQMPTHYAQGTCRESTRRSLP